MKLISKPAITTGSMFPEHSQSWKVLLVDDDLDIIKVTQLSLRNFTYAQKSLEILTANSLGQAKEILHQHSDIAIVALDVVMENEDDGLQLVKYIRDKINNQMSRIIICTGQPGLAPERYVVDNYDIDNYLSKTNLTTTNLHSKMRLAIRSYDNLLNLKRHREGLERILNQVPKVSALGRESKTLLFKALLDQMIFFCATSSLLIDFKLDGFVAYVKDGKPTISSAQGRFSNLPERSTETFTLLQRCIELSSNSDSSVDASELLVPMKSGNVLVAFVYLQTGVSLTPSERSLIEVFVNHCSSLLENLNLYNELDRTYQQAINTFAEMAEHKDDDTAMHLNRIAAYTRLVAVELGLTVKKAQHWGQAARLHDIGKMGIPDSILQKPDKLTEDEFAVMRTHTLIGASILGRMDHMEVAKDIALSHHEHWNGKGYPKALKGDQIPLAARIVALVDVFDALVNKRCYKEAWTIQHALDYLHVHKGKQFDPEVVDAFDRLHAQGFIAKLIKDSATLELGLD